MQEDTKQGKNRAAQEAAQADKEQKIREDHQSKEAKRTEKSLAGEAKQHAREQARKAADLKKELSIAADLEARKRKYDK